MAETTPNPQASNPQPKPQYPKNPKYLVFFHNGCPDGVCAAAVAERYVVNTEGFIGMDKLQLIPTDPARVSDALVKAYAQAPEAGTVLMFDVALRQADFNKLLELFPHARAYDHHQTTQAVTPHPQLILDQSVSGAELAWRHFFPDQTQPAIVSYIGDRDTWKWQLPKSRDVAKYMTGHLTTVMQQDRGYISVPDVWFRHLTYDDWLLTAFSEGAALTSYENTLLKRMAARHMACMINNQLVGVLEASELQSEVGELLYNAEGKLANEFRGIPAGTVFRYSYVIMWCYDANQDKIRLSFRSSHTPFNVLDEAGELLWEGPADVEKIASERYKGGGHKAAAGGTCTVHHLFNELLSLRAPDVFRIQI